MIKNIWFAKNLEKAENIIREFIKEMHPLEKKWLEEYLEIEILHIHLVKEYKYDAFKNVTA